MYEISNINYFISILLVENGICFTMWKINSKLVELYDEVF